MFRIMRVRIKREEKNTQRALRRPNSPGLLVKLDLLKASIYLCLLRPPTIEAHTLSGGPTVLPFPIWNHYVTFI
jgi:hypothetical protein